MNSRRGGGSPGIRSHSSVGGAHPTALATYDDDSQQTAVRCAGCDLYRLGLLFRRGGARVQDDDLSDTATCMYLVLRADGRLCRACRARHGYESDAGHCRMHRGLAFVAVADGHSRYLCIDKVLSMRCIYVGWALLTVPVNASILIRYVA